MLLDPDQGAGADEALACLSGQAREARVDSHEFLTEKEVDHENQ
jgi:hypothetical protein